MPARRCTPARPLEGCLVPPRNTAPLTRPCAATPGTGGYAVVKLGTHKSTGQEVAVKIMRLPLADQSRSRPQYTPMGVGHTSGSGVSTAAASSEIDVFKEIEILKTLDQCVHARRRSPCAAAVGPPDAPPACLPAHTHTPARPC